jgi:hypothetical protein
MNSDTLMTVAFALPFVLLVLVIFVGYIRSLRSPEWPRLTPGQEAWVVYLLRHQHVWPDTLRQQMNEALEQQAFSADLMYYIVKLWVQDHPMPFDPPGSVQSSSAIYYGAQVWDASEFKRYQEGRDE